MEDKPYPSIDFKSILERTPAYYKYLTPFSFFDFTEEYIGVLQTSNSIFAYYSWEDNEKFLDDFMKKDPIEQSNIVKSCYSAITKANFTRMLWLEDQKIHRKKLKELENVKLNNLPLKENDEKIGETQLIPERKVQPITPAFYLLSSKKQENIKLSIKELICFHKQKFLVRNRTFDFLEFKINNDLIFVSKDACSNYIKDALPRKIEEEANKKIKYTTYSMYKFACLVLLEKNPQYVKKNTQKKKKDEEDLIRRMKEDKDLVYLNYYITQ